MTRLPSLGQMVRMPTVASMLAEPHLKQYLTPEEEASALEQLGSGALSGLAYVGGSLDKAFGGRAIRGLLGGKPEELLSIVPFSDAMGLTDASNAVSGRDLLESADILDANTPGLDWGDVAGFGAEVLLDPGSFISGPSKALTAGGKALKSAGILDNVASAATRVGRMDTLVGDVLDMVKPEAMEAFRRAAGPNADELMSQPIAGAFGLGIPGMAPSMAVKGGALGRAFAGGLDALEAAAKYGTIPGTDFSPGMHLSKMFDSDVRETSTRLGQVAARKMSQELRAVDADAAMFANEQISRAFDAGLLNDTDAIRNALEFPSQASGPLQDIGLANQARSSQRLAELQSAHRKLDPLDDAFIESPAARFMTKKEGPAGAQKSFVFDDPSAIKRSDELRDIPGGTNTLRDLFSNPAILAAKREGKSTEEIAKLIESEMGGVIPPTYTKRLSAKELKSGKEAIGNRYDKLAKTIAGTPIETLEAGMFGNHPLVDQAVRDRNQLIAKVASKTIVDMLSSADAYGATGVSLKKVLKGSKLTKSSLDEIAKRLGVDASTLANRTVRADVAEDILHGIGGFKSPQPVNALVKGLDSFLNIFKAGVTGPWPSFNTRNFVSGQVKNWMRGSFSFESVNAMRRIVHGGNWAGAKDVPLVRKILAKRGLPVDDQSATNVIRELLSSYGMSGQYAGEAVDRIGGAAVAGGIDEALKSIPGGFSGSQPFSWKGMAKKYAGATPDTTRNPLHVRGVGQQVDTRFGPVAAGEDASYLVEALNRGAPFIKQLQEGVAPDVAAAAVNRAQINYRGGNFTAFERQVMSRVMPFYKFTKGSATDTIKELFSSPGGKEALTIKGMSDARDDREFMPPHVSDGASIRLEPGPSGDPRFLTSLGLMFEGPLGLVGGSPKETALELLSQTNPLIKGTLEAATGQSFFQAGPLGGRDINQSDPVLGRILANVSGQTEPVPLPTILERAVPNSPLARLATSARTLTDPRKDVDDKALNLLTGVKVTDVSQRAQDAALRDEIRASLEGNRNIGTFEDIYVKNPERLTPEDRRLIALLKLQQQRKRQAAKGGRF